MRPWSMTRSVSASQVDVSSRVMYPANVAWPERTIGAAYDGEGAGGARRRPDARPSQPAAAEPEAGDRERDRERRGELGGRAASSSTRSASTTMQREPEREQQGAGQARRPATCSTSSPQPSESTARTSGKTIQASSTIGARSARATGPARSRRRRRASGRRSETGRRPRSGSRTPGRRGGCSSGTRRRRRPIPPCASLIVAAPFAVFATAA